MVVDYDGRILAQADPGPGEKVVVAPLNIGALRAERERRRGHDLRSHLRSEVHGYLAKSYLRPGGETLTVESNNKRIQEAKEKLLR